MIGFVYGAATEADFLLVKNQGLPGGDRALRLIEFDTSLLIVDVDNCTGLVLLPIAYFCAATKR